MIVSTDSLPSPSGAPAEAPFDEDGAARNAWITTFAVLYRSRDRYGCSAGQAHDIACLVYPSMQSLDALSAAESVLRDDDLARVLRAHVEAQSGADG